MSSFADLASTIAVPITFLEQDKKTLLRLWRTMNDGPRSVAYGRPGGMDESVLRDGDPRADNYPNVGADRDDVSKWRGIKVEGGRVTKLYWTFKGLMGLTGTMPAEIGELSALTYLDLEDNFGLRGKLPPELGNLTALTYLSLRNNSFTGAVPSSLAKLTNLDSIGERPLTTSRKEYLLTLAL